MAAVGPLLRESLCGVEGGLRRALRACVDDLEALSFRM